MRPPSADAAILVKGLVKHYGDFTAVDGIDLEIEHGEIFSVLGPNGAGKTTTVEILEGFRKRDAGEVRVLGLDPGRDRTALKARVGVVLQSTAVDNYLTVRETVSMFAGLFEHPRPVDEVIDLVGLAEKRDGRVAQLSGGQQRRLDMAVALAGDPELLFLDEPTTGFDPTARHEAWETIKDLAALGKTVLLTTHFMDEAQYLSRRVAVMVKGRVVALGPPTQLGIRDEGVARVRFRIAEGIAPPDGFRGEPRADGFREVAVADAVGEVHRLLQWALDEQVNLEGFEVLRPSLEDEYLLLTEGANPEDGSDGRTRS